MLIELGETILLEPPKGAIAAKQVLVISLGDEKASRLAKHVERNQVSIRKLFASDRELFANGGKSIMMGTHCLHCRTASGNSIRQFRQRHRSTQ